MQIWKQINHTIVIGCTDNDFSIHATCRPLFHLHPGVRKDCHFLVRGAHLHVKMRFFTLSPKPTHVKIISAKISKKNKNSRNPSRRSSPHCQLLAPTAVTPEGGGGGGSAFAAHRRCPAARTCS